jgi:KUP system potassium uptake protein
MLWRKPLWIALGGAAAFLLVDLTFLSANVTKLFHGGWFPVGIALIVFTVLTAWQRGRAIVTDKRTEEEGSLREFIDEINDFDPPLARVPGTAVFLNHNLDTVPLAMRANVEHNHALHQSVVILSIVTMKVPHVARSERIVVDDLGFREDGITHLSVRFGFQDEPNVPDALRLAAEEHDIETEVDIETPSYFLSKVTLVETREPNMPRWRKRLFLATARLSSNPAEYFGLPIDRTVVMGSQIAV